MDQWNPEGKTQRLRTLYQDWRDCDKCELHETRHNICFGNGNADADIMFIGGGPGQLEDETGKVFVGASGHLLNALLEAAGISREEVFITNLVMCQPPENRDPMKVEREACFDRLWHQIYAVDPMLIVTVGKPATEALMGSKWKAITNQHGKFGYVEIPGKVEDVVRYPAMPMLNPSFINREDKINSKTMNWEQGGWAHETMRDLAKARQRVEWLKEQYRPAQREALKVLR